MRSAGSRGLQQALLLAVLLRLLAHGPTTSESYGWLMLPPPTTILPSTTRTTTTTTTTTTTIPRRGTMRPHVLDEGRRSGPVVRTSLGAAGEADASDLLLVNGEEGSSRLLLMTADDLADLDELSAAAAGPTIPMSDTGADLIQPLAPPLSYDKFLKMQDKRVVVTIRYSGESGLRPYFLTVAKKLKASHPDVVLERRILPSVDKKDGTNGGEAVFEILVDGKVVIGKKNRTRRQRVSMDLTKSRSVYVSMQELDVAISRARRRRRPTTAYGGGTDELQFSGNNE